MRIIHQLLLDHLSICPLINQSINMINKLIQQSINKIVLSIRYDLDMLNALKVEKSKLVTIQPTELKIKETAVIWKY